MMAHQIIVCAEVFQSDFLIGAIRKFAAGMEGEFEPVRLINEFLLVAIRHLFQGEFLMGIVIEAVQSDFQPPLLMDLLEPLQIEVIKGVLQALSGQICKQEDIVIDIEIEAFERLFVPNDFDFLAVFAQSTCGRSGDRIEFGGQRYRRDKTPPAADCRNSVHQDCTTMIAYPFD